jgi:hypothetical protein
MIPRIIIGSFRFSFDVLVADTANRPGPIIIVEGIPKKQPGTLRRYSTTIPSCKRNIGPLITLSNLSMPDPSRGKTDGGAVAPIAGFFTAASLDRQLSSVA